MPKVSIIIPNYNHSKYLHERINSVLEQKFQDYEVIILDDFSNDHSCSIIEQYKNHPKISRIIYNVTNSGSTFKQWNRGIELAKGEIIWIAESDDFADSTFLENLVHSFVDPNIGIAYCQSLAIDSKSQVTGNWKHWTDEFDPNLFENVFTISGLDYIDRFLIYKNTIPNCSAVLFRKKLFNQIGGADGTLKYCSDWLVWLQILSISNISFTPQSLNSFRYHKESVIATATEEMSRNSFIPRFDNEMRKKYDTYLQKNASSTKIGKLIEKNKMLIADLNVREGIYEIGNKKWLSGWKKILNATLTPKLTLKPILTGVKTSVLVIYRTQYKIVK